MKRKVLKYRMTDKDSTLHLPEDTRVLSAKAQGNTLVVYAEVSVLTEEDAPEVALKDTAIHFYIMDTGEELPENIYEYTFLDSVFLSGTAVWCHVYYKQS